MLRRGNVCIVSHGIAAAQITYSLERFHHLMINHLLAKLWVPTKEGSSSFPFKFRSGLMLLCSHVVAASKDHVYIKCCYVRQDWLFFLKGVKRNRLVSNSWLKLGFLK